VERIIKGRNNGKTKQLMMLAKKNDAIFLCENPYAMTQKALAYGITGLQIMGYDRFYDEEECAEKVVIDELENFVSYFTNNDIIGYTLTDED
jgi:hypothetical protein